MFATIYLPNFFLQAAIRHEDISLSTPIALIDEQETKPLIIQLNEPADSAGVRVGMSPSQGLARCLELLIKTRSAAKEHALTNLLLQYAFSLTPNVEATAPGIWTVEFTRPHNLEAKIAGVVKQLGDCHVNARAGLAPTPDLSFLAANLTSSVLQINEPEKFLPQLPIDVLALPFQR